MKGPHLWVKCRVNIGIDFIRWKEFIDKKSQGSETALGFELELFSCFRFLIFLYFAIDIVKLVCLWLTYAVWNLKKHELHVTTYTFITFSISIILLAALTIFQWGISLHYFDTKDTKSASFTELNRNNSWNKFVLDFNFLYEDGRNWSKSWENV